MRETQLRRFLEIDSGIDLLLGAALLVMPKATINLLGLPATKRYR